MATDGVATALAGLPVLVAVAGGVATALVAGARRADSSFVRFLDVTGAPNFAAQVALGQDVPGQYEDVSERFSIGPDVVKELAAIPGVETVRVESWLAINLAGELDPPGVVTAFAVGTSVTHAALVGTPLAGCPPPADRRTAVRVSVGGHQAVALVPPGVMVSVPLPDAAPSGALEGS